MNLKNQVVSLELAKKLKDLGVKQESLWWWNKNFFNNGKWYLDLTYIQERPITSVNGYCKTCFKQLNWNGNKGECDCSIWYRKNSVIVWKQWKVKPEFYSAFTVPELLHLFILKTDGTILIPTKKGKDYWQAQCWEKYTLLIYYNEKKLVDAIAKIIIYLIENKLIKV